MKLISMKVESNDGLPNEYCDRSYGYGLSLYLNSEQCEALGISETIKPGTQVTLQAMAIITNASESIDREGDDAGTDISLSLQITDLGIEAGAPLKDAAKKLYGSGADD